MSEATEEEQAQRDWLEKRNVAKDKKGQQFSQWTLSVLLSPDLFVLWNILLTTARARFFFALVLLLGGLACKKPNLPFMVQQNTMQAGESRALCVRFHPYSPELMVADGWDHMTYVLHCILDGLVIKIWNDGRFRIHLSLLYT